MKILILTQSVDSDDQALGFFLDWINEFAKRCEKVSVICLKKGKYNFPANVFVYSLGKEEGESRTKYLKNFFKYIFTLRNEYDSVFVHMNYVYVVLGGLFWRTWNNKVALWYVHRQKSFGLWISQFLVNTIFTSSPESFGYKSKKVVYVGHGIDSLKFVCQNKNNDETKIRIVHVGRITLIKNLETLISATEILHKKFSNLSVELIGKPITEADKKYFEQLKGTVKSKHLEDVVLFRGIIPSAEIAQVYCDATASVNLAPTGGWDKAVIESLMAKCPVFASNQSIKPVFGKYGEYFLFEQNNPVDLARRIEAYLSINYKNKIIDELNASVIKEYDLKNLIANIVVNLSV